jgi:hypothetical protein
MNDEAFPYLMQLYKRVFASQDPALVQLPFDASVLDRYRGAPGFELIRTETIGRVKREGGWAIDVGIADGGRTLHACLGDVLNALPDAEREHWAQHAVPIPSMSRFFLQARLAPGGCIDDGEVRPWD